MLLVSLMSTISSFAQFYDFKSENNGVIIYYNIKGKNVAVVNGDYKYSGNIAIPESVVYDGTSYTVTEISSFSFNGCAGLESIILPNSLEIIGMYAFSDCNSLKQLSIPNNVSTIGSFKNPKRISFNTIGAEWATKFCKYLCNEAENQNYQKAKDESRRKHVALSDNGQVKMWAYLRILFNKAIDEKCMKENPCDKVKKNLLPKPKQSKREFLEVDELKRLINTPFPETRSKGELKEAFLFACFCGLRFSDLSTLTLSDIYEDTNGKYLEKTMIKTKEDVKVYLPDVALQLIPERERADNEPIFILPRNNNCNANVALKKWFENAGIRKHLTFHCPRHTFATVLLSNGEDIETVSKLLGHQSIAVTQVYADIVDKKKAEAKNRLNNIFA